MSRDKETIENFRRLEEYHIEQALQHLSQQEFDLQEHLADFIASLCDVDRKTMLSDCKSISIAHARWLYWYVYRYVTDESYIKIAERTEKFYGKRFAFQNIASGIARMGVMIEMNPMWRKRWIIMQRLIKQWDEEHGCRPIDNTITIQVPRDLRDKVKIEIIEK